MRVALADDYALFRAGLRSALSDAFAAPLEVLEASSFAQLMEILASDGELDLVLCDWRIPGMDPASGLAALVAKRPQTPLVVISASEDPADACRAIEQGARGYVLKSDSLIILHRALELVLAGGIYAPALALVARYRKAENPCASLGGEAPWADALPRLSARQRMIVERLADGKPNKTIARELGIAEGTVKAQLRSVFRKLGVKNRTQAALFAAEIFGSGPAAEVPATEEALRSASIPGLAAPAQPLPFQQVKGANLKVVNYRS